MTSNGKLHFWVSAVKSSIRMAGSLTAIAILAYKQDVYNAIFSFALSIVIAETLGVVEELVDKR